MDSISNTIRQSQQFQNIVKKGGNVRLKGIELEAEDDGAKIVIKIDQLDLTIKEPAKK